MLPQHPSSSLGHEDRYITPPTSTANRSADPAVYKPYVQQTTFNRGHADYRRVRDANAVTVLMEAIAMGRALGTSARGLKIAAYLIDLHGPRPERQDLAIMNCANVMRFDSPTEALVRSWYSETRVEYTCRRLEAVREGAPAPSAIVPGGQLKEGVREICYNATLVDAAAECLEQDGQDSIGYRAMLFHLAVVGFHENTHVVRSQLVPGLDPTPPHISSSRGDHVERDGVEWGESGWWAEEILVGGFLGRILAEEPAFDGELETLVVCTGVADRTPYFMLDRCNLDPFFQADPDYDRLLPLSPSRPAAWVNHGAAPARLAQRAAFDTPTRVPPARTPEVGACPGSGWVAA